ncbi:hypothetical protein [Bdellovibrio sp. HCB-162]|uniref:hypothetical protein n=1 Tax=Bdellovibrio sp. HCB-162 TaxID=3394234 RepID=UPI0039BC5DC2
MSDSIVLALKVHQEKQFFKQLAEMIRTIANMQYELALELNIWTRGAISVGSLFINPEENILVGQAYVDAYHLERSADFGRVILDPKIIKALKFRPHTLAKRLQNENSPILNFMPTDDFLQVDWFGCLLKKSSEKRTKKILERVGYAEQYFEDLRNRRTENTVLFNKSQKTLLFLARAVKQYLSNHKNASRETKKIIKNLEWNVGEKYLQNPRKTAN